MTKELELIYLFTWKWGGMWEMRRGFLENPGRKISLRLKCELKAKVSMQMQPKSRLQESLTDARSGAFWLKTYWKNP